MTVVLASVVLAAIFACPCPAMAADGHGCCADESGSIGPSDCCRASASPASWTPRIAPAAPVVAFVPVSVSLPAAPLSASPMTSGVPFLLSPPPVLRI